ncbi:Abc-1 domain protein [Thalictrum thalictroides]|uniref:Abc-1 domain protein n=1 Tax=Thalictrum thalictroides TaxID=46969 RepID=A0A7J6WNJ0_THATH|nr:Abc-1 domain protein [Thalictrum thalictroides]
MSLLLPPSFHQFTAKSNSKSLLSFHKSDIFTQNFSLVPSIHHFRSSKTIRICAKTREIDTFTKYSGYVFESVRDSEADAMVDYNVSKIASIYGKKPFLLLRRLFQISTSLGQWFGLRYIDGLMQRSDQMFKIRAAELRKILAELGPAFVKIAQAVSSRPDLIPPAYINELSLLQDRITPFSSKVAFNTIEQELGLPLEMVFSEISPEPIAAASLGQVYKARLRDNAQIVAVKVQRPGVQAAISLDIYILRFLVGIVRNVAKVNTDLQAVVDEWASSLFREMDYREEAQNGMRFRQLYGSLEDVCVPEMYLKQSSRRVLTMEWVEGQKLAEVKDLYLVEVGVYCSLTQLLEYGFYHADPHPGNLMRTYDGKLAYLDFGMMGEFRPELRDGFIEACLHLVNRDYDALAEDFVTLGLLPPTVQKDAATEALTGVFKNAVDKGVRNLSFGDLSGNLGFTMYKFKFQIPSYFSLVIRSLAVLEGIAISLNPDYKVLGSSYPWIARKVLTDSSPKLRSSLQALLYKEGVFRVDLLESLLSESLRAKTERVLEGPADRGSRLVIKQTLQFMLNEKGTFIREILIQELAKGLDALGLATTSAAISRLPFATSFSLSNEDLINLETLRRLMLFLSRLQNNDSSNKEVNNMPREAEVLGIQLASVQEIIPIFSTIIELAPESREQLLLLPADLAGRLVSRVAARTIYQVT